MSTRNVDALVQALVQALGLSGVDKSAISRICRDLDEVVEQLRQRPLHARYPYLWLDALYLKVRQNYRIVSQAVVIAVGARDTGEREVLGFAEGASDKEAVWCEFLRGVELVVSDAHAGLTAAITSLLQGARWQRCQVHTIRTQSIQGRICA